MNAFTEPIRDEVSLSSSAYGRIAELRAAEELLRRGHKVAVPIVDDDGVDLVVNYQWRVQVKNSWRSVQMRGPKGKRYSYRGYSWSTKRGWASADFHILRGEASDDAPERWWIIPHYVASSHGTNLAIYDGASRGRARMLASYEDRWDLFDV